MVNRFTSQSGLTLNLQKCEILVSCTQAQRCTDIALASINGQDMKAQKEVKCLGHWWSWDLSANKAVSEAINKSRRAFFMHKTQVFEGNLNPLSGKTLFEACVIPILLYGSENWQMTPNTISQLESFQGEIGRRILRLTPYHSAYSSMIALRWPSVAARILVVKLKYLLRLRSPAIISKSIASKVYKCSKPVQLSLVRECKFLEEHTGLEGYTDKVINGEFDGQSKTLKKSLLVEEWHNTIEKAKQRESTQIVANIACEVSWLKLWDTMLNEGMYGTRALQSLITWPSIGGASICPICKNENSNNLLSHFIRNHLPSTTEDKF